MHGMYRYRTWCIEMKSQFLSCKLCLLRLLLERNRHVASYLKVEGSIGLYVIFLHVIMKKNKKRVHFLSGGNSPCPMKHAWKIYYIEKIIAKIHSNRFSIYLFINKKNMHWTCCYNIDSAESYGSLLYDLISNKYVSRYITEPQKNLFTILFIF